MGVVHRDHPARVVHRQALVLGVAAGLDQNVPCVQGTDVDQRQRERSGLKLLHQRTDAGRQAGPLAVRIEIPHQRMERVPRSARVVGAQHQMEQ